jgi:hypothetical protein
VFGRKLTASVAMAMLVLLAVSPAFAASVDNPGTGDTIGGGNLAHPDNGRHTAAGGGQSNNPNPSGSRPGCSPRDPRGC